MAGGPKRRKVTQLLLIADCHAPDGCPILRNGRCPSALRQSFGLKPEGKTLGGETVQDPGAEMRRGRESARLGPNGQRGVMSRRGPEEIGAPAGRRMPNREGGRDWWS